MKPLTNLFLKVTLQAALLYGLAMIVLALIGGDTLEPANILISALIFGAVLAAILVFWQQDRLKKMGIEEIREEHLRARQQRTITSRISTEELVARLKKDGELGLSGLEEDENGLRFNTRMTQTSWGEKIAIEFGPAEKGEREITVTSRPRFALTLLDYGKNYENLERIEKMIRRKR